MTDLRSSTGFFRVTGMGLTRCMMGPKKGVVSRLSFIT